MALGLLMLAPAPSHAQSAGADAGSARSKGAPTNGAPATETTAAPRPGRRVRAFFSGHSLLDNPLPNWIEAMALSRGDSLGWQQQIVLGSPIRIRTRGEDPEGHAFEGYRLGRSRAGGPIDVLGELANPVQLAPGERYDHLVIAERVDLLGTMQWEGTIAYLRDYHDRVARHAPNATTLLYQVWPEIDRRDPAAWIGYVETELFAWECVAARVNDGLAAESRPARVRVVPAGLALAGLVGRAIDGHIPGVEGSVAQRVDAIFKDDLHLTPMAIYLMAAMHYGVLFDESPVGVAGAEGVAPELLPLLQSLAESTLAAYRSRAERPPTLDSCVARIADDVCPAYHRIHGRAARAERCELWRAPDGPLAGGLPAGASLLSFGWRSAAALVMLAAAGWGWLRFRGAYPHRARG